MTPSNYQISASLQVFYFYQQNISAMLDRMPSGIETTFPVFQFAKKCILINGTVITFIIIHDSKHHYEGINWRHRHNDYTIKQGRKMYFRRQREIFSSSSEEMYLTFKGGKVRRKSSSIQISDVKKQKWEASLF